MQGHDQLAKIFGEPSYRFEGNLESAKKAGKQKNAWILVNIQNADDFGSHCLNRDVWNDKEFSEMIQCCFVFCQYNQDQSQGSKFVNLYDIPSVPCLCVIDPNTGKKEQDFKIPDNTQAIVTIKDDGM